MLRTPPCRHANPSLRAAAGPQQQGGKGGKGGDEEAGSTTVINYSYFDSGAVSWSRCAALLQLVGVAFICSRAGASLPPTIGPCLEQCVSSSRRGHANLLP